MYTKQTKIKHRTGLHARPASDFVKAAKGFSSEINIWRVGAEEEAVNAKSIILLLSLGLGQDETVGIKALGNDEVVAVDTLIELIDSGFGEL